MSLETRAKSLTDLIDQDIAEVYLLDSCAIGIDFLCGGSSLRIWINDAIHNNVNMHKLRESLKSATCSLTLLERYQQVGTVPVISKELEEKQKYLKKYARYFGIAGRHESSRNGRIATHHQRKKRILDKIMPVEEEIMRILKGRIYAENEGVLKPFEDLVTAAYTDIGFVQPTKNNNDERLVAAAFYLAVRRKKYAAIISNDGRIKSIIIRAQKLIYADTARGEPIREELELGKVMLLSEMDKNKGYELKYCTQDFIEQYPEVPKSLVGKVEASGT